MAEFVRACPSAVSSGVECSIVFGGIRDRAFFDATLGVVGAANALAMAIFDDGAPNRWSVYMSAEAAFGDLLDRPSSARRHHSAITIHDTQDVLVRALAPAFNAVLDSSVARRVDGCAVVRAST
jgi:hypothetical protein